MLNLIQRAGCTFAVVLLILTGAAPSRAQGNAWAWGSNGDGQLGNGTDTDSSVPVQVFSGLSGVVGVAGGGSTSLALKTDGTVWTWGYNSDGELGNGTTTNSSVPVRVTGLSGVVGVAGGDFHSLAVKNDGTVWTWGDDRCGQLGNGTSSRNNSVPVR